jgi:hypothetical protein
MKRTVALAAFALVALAALIGGCRAKDDPVRQLDGSTGVDTAAMGSYYSGPQPWEAQAREAYKVPQPTDGPPAAAKK